MQTAKVRLRKPNRVLTFLCAISLNRAECCVVRTGRGLEYGTCIMPPEPCSEEMADRIAIQVIRRATEHDTTMFKRILADEARARDICARKIAETNIPMKLVDAEYTFDRRKVIFYFTAEQRVDFRELVRDLAHALRTRIELRHIQVRDQAKMVGGIGECGRLLCCRTWLREFMPISMKMAKRQNLSLNPEKISGQCGRLMCCLAYESDQYEDKKKRKPRPEPIIKTEPAPEAEELEEGPEVGEPVEFEPEPEPQPEPSEPIEFEPAPKPQPEPVSPPEEEPAPQPPAAVKPDVAKQPEPKAQEETQPPKKARRKGRRRKQRGKRSRDRGAKNPQGSAS